MVSFSGGAGFALAMAAIFFSYLWYQARPKPQRPWDTKAIQASFDTVDVTGDDNHIVFYYILENTTDVDYRVDSSDGVSLTAKLESQHSLSSFDGYEKIHFPIFIPAKQRMRFAVEIPYPYPEKLAGNAPKEDRHKWREKLVEFLKSEMSNLNGFVLFDANNRCQVNFPRPW